MVVVGGAGVGAASLPLDAAMAMPAMTAAPSKRYRVVFSPIWARFTPAGWPVESRAELPAKAAELVKLKASMKDTKRI